MKTLVVYGKDGNILFTQSPVEDDYTCNYLIADVPDNRIVARVENGEVILEDTPDVKEAKEKLKMLNEEIYEIKLKLLANFIALSLVIYFISIKSYK